MASMAESVWFLGDLSDPWVVSIAETVARCARVVHVHAPGNLPEAPFERGSPPRLIIVHRHHLNTADIQRLRDYRGLTPAAADAQPFLILCTGPFVRYEETERIVSLVDLLVSEADAAEVLPRHLAVLVDRREKRQIPPGAEKICIEVAGRNHDLCQSVVAACVAAGYRTSQVADLESADSGATAIQSPPPRQGFLTVWDVPVLEPDWPERLRRRARPGAPVLALIGFADRDSVTLAKANGACACLELPYHVDDLVDVIDRAASVLSVQAEVPPSRVEPPHHTPPPPKHRRNAAATRAARSQTWSDSRRESKVK